jgi:hypothetical protein
MHVEFEEINWKKLKILSQHSCQTVRRKSVLRNLERPQRHWKYCKLMSATLYYTNVGIMLGFKDDCAFVHEGLTKVKLPAAEKHILWQNVANHILPHQVKTNY